MNTKWGRNVVNLKKTSQMKRGPCVSCLKKSVATPKFRLVSKGYARSIPITVNRQFRVLNGQVRNKCYMYFAHKHKTKVCACDPKRPLSIFSLLGAFELPSWLPCFCCVAPCLRDPFWISKWRWMQKRKKDMRKFGGKQLRHEKQRYKLWYVSTVLSKSSNGDATPQKSDTDNNEKGNRDRKTKRQQPYLGVEDIIRMKTLLEDAGWGVGQVAAALKVSREYVEYWITNSFQKKKRSGRFPLVPYVLFNELLLNNATLPLPTIQEKIKKFEFVHPRHGVPSIETLRKYCTRLKFSFKTIKQRHQLTDREKKMRLYFSRMWLSVPLMKNVWYVDESSMFICFNTGKAWVRHGYREPDIRAKRNYNIYLRFWAGISYDGKTKLVCHTSKFTGVQYSEVIIEHLVPIATKIHGSTWILYQDNDSTSCRECVAALRQTYSIFCRPLS